MKNSNTHTPVAETKPTSLDQIHEKLATQYLFAYTRELKRNQTSKAVGTGIPTASLINLKKEKDETK